MKNINANALRNSALEVIAMCAAKKYKVADIIAHWNLCVEQAGYTGTFDIPTCYKRKSSIVGDMDRIALQLERIANDCDPTTGAPNKSISEQQREEVAAFEKLVEEQRAAGLPVDEEGNDTREWCGNDIEASHAEALEMNKQFVKANARHYHWWNIYTYSTRMDLLEKAHAQALEMDAKVNQALLALSSNPLSAGWYLHSPTMKEQAIRVAHIQALEMNPTFKGHV